MGMIFDRFPTLDLALRFTEDALERLGGEHDIRIYTSADRAGADDLFPFELTAPVVIVARVHEWDTDIGGELERVIEALVGGYQGRFAGT